MRFFFSALAVRSASVAMSARCGYAVSSLSGVLASSGSPPPTSNDPPAAAGHHRGLEDVVGAQRVERSGRGHDLGRGGGHRQPAAHRVRRRAGGQRRDRGEHVAAEVAVAEVRLHRAAYGVAVQPRSLRQGPGDGLRDVDRGQLEPGGRGDRGRLGGRRGLVLEPAVDQVVAPGRDAAGDQGDDEEDAEDPQHRMPSVLSVTPGHHRPFRATQSEPLCGTLGGRPDRGRSR